MLNINSASAHHKKLFFLIGSMGCGKSFWADILSKEKGFHFIDLDKVIEAEANDTIANIFKTKGEAFFRSIETIQLEKIISNNDDTIIATGGGTACFNDNLKLMNSNGVTIWLNESIENIVERITPYKLTRPLIASIDNEQIYTYINSLLKDRIAYYSKCQYQLACNEINKSNLLKIINQNV